MTKRELEKALKRVVQESKVGLGELHRIFWKVLVDQKKEIGWEAPTRRP